MIRAAAISLAGCLLALPATALDLTLPSVAELAHDETESATYYSLPVSPWLGDRAEMRTVEGALARHVWQVAEYDGNSAQLMAPLRAQLEDQGYEIVFACDATLCGGFDFRFAMDVTPEPAMHVDLGDFSYLVARLDTEEGVEHIGLLTSRGGARGYIHMVRISPADMAPVGVSLSTRSPNGAEIGTLRTRLTADGAATLADLSFTTGSSTLTEGDYPALADLAAFLADNPETRVVLVGHTDAEGSLEGNIALSRDRAGAVRRYLIDRLGVDPAQLQAEGVGYLAPRASNASTLGREQNRRVEVVVTSTR
ncbi:MAG: OmpA family protein [Rhodobacteraceae bacterium CG17_big_fil_post_rev_8_21_14_2_50_65_11]|nr:MAG: OmpA family protein [Rhodobacteraceae bacterium CG17_big_fil_post_rev_8_21_14_2_50_65_11]